jgi:ribulose-phosphate 3-epimerase
MDRIDLIVVMSVNPGFGGQAFIPQALRKIEQVRQRIEAHEAAGGQPIALEVDGGVKVDNIRAIALAGADTLVAGSVIFGAPDADGGYRTVISAMRRELGSAAALRRAA